MAFIKCSGGGGSKEFSFITLKAQTSAVNLKNNSPFILSESLNNYKDCIISFAAVSNNVLVSSSNNYSNILIIGNVSQILASSPINVGISQGGGSTTISVTITSTSVSFTSSLSRTLYVYGLKY